MKISLDPEAWSPGRTTKRANSDAPPLTFGDQYVVRKLTTALERRAAEIAASIYNGAAGDFPAYREAVGELRGLNWATERLSTVQQEVNQGGETAPKLEESLYGQ